MASGVSGSLAAAHHLGWLNLGSQVAFSLEIAGNGLFGIASLIALIQNIKIYRAASKVCESAPLHEKEAANKLKTSSMMGILSNLNYIIGAALLMIGSLATLALLFGCIAVFIGGLKILYDFLQFRNAY
ncbi:MAG: hypothetical protein HWD61_13825 [Parachlamydiaceae bacterium]|nr:MAG: hypothetical protein HWD61_13825 [Parachlamydiaceae bacterium]